MVGVMFRPFCVWLTWMLQWCPVLFPFSLQTIFCWAWEPRKGAVRSSHKWNANRSCGSWLAKGSTPLSGKKGNTSKNQIKHVSVQGLFLALSPVWGKMGEWARVWYVILEGALRGRSGDHMWSGKPSTGHQSLGCQEESRRKWKCWETSLVLCLNTDESQISSILLIVCSFILVETSKN